MHSLVMSPFSCDFIKTDVDYQQCFNSHGARFLDGRTSLLVFPNQTCLSFTTGETSIDVLPSKNQALCEYYTLVSKLKHC